MGVLAFTVLWRRRLRHNTGLSSYMRPMPIVAAEQWSISADR